MLPLNRAVSVAVGYASNQLLYTLIRSQLIISWLQFNLYLSHIYDSFYQSSDEMYMLAITNPSVKLNI